MFDFAHSFMLIYNLNLRVTWQVSWVNVVLWYANIHLECFGYLSKRLLRLCDQILLFLPYINFCLSFKVKGKVPLCMPWHKGSGDMAPLILNLGSSWRWLVSFMPGCLISGERACVTWSRACLDILDKSKYLAPIGIWILDYPANSIVTILTELSWLCVWWPLILFIAHIISCMVTYIF